MATVPRAALALLPAVAMLAACSPAAPAASSPTPSLSVSAAEPADTLPRSGAELEAFLATALPENLPGGGGWLSRGSGPVTDGGTTIDVVRETGAYDLVVACQSEDGSPVSLVLDTPAATAAEPMQVSCSPPGASQDATAVMRYDASPDSVIRVTATADAVYAYGIRLVADDGS